MNIKNKDNVSILELKESLSNIVSYCNNNDECKYRECIFADKYNKCVLT